MNTIPSDEEFAAAKRKMAERSKNLDAASGRVVEAFRKQSAVSKVFILPQRDVDFRVYVFFSNDSDLDSGIRSGACEKISDFVYEELERQGRGSRSTIRIAFEFDSDENVRKNYEGDYYLRLR